MRNLMDVTKQLKEISSKEKFIHQLDKIEKSYFYTAPESMGLLWNRVHDAILSEYIVEVVGEPSDECVEILSCFTTMSIDEVKETFK